MPEETITLGPNSQSAVNIKGRFFAVLSCTAAFKVEPNQGGKRSCAQGTRYLFDNFRRLTFYETSGVANTVTYWADEAEFDGTIPTQNGAVPVVAAGGIPLQVVDADTFDYPYLMDNDGSLLFIDHDVKTDLPAEIEIDGSNYRRKSFHISNHTNDDLYIFKDTGECLDILLSNTDRTFSFSFDVAIEFLSHDGSNKIALYYTLFSTPVS